MRLLQTVCHRTQTVAIERMRKEERMVANGAQHVEERMDQQGSQQCYGRLVNSSDVDIAYH